MNKLFKIEIKTEMNKTIIFFVINLIIHSVSKLYFIVYNLKVKILLITYFYFVNNQYIIIFL